MTRSARWLMVLALVSGACASPAPPSSTLNPSPSDRPVPSPTSGPAATPTTMSVATAELLLHATIPQLQEAMNAGSLTSVGLVDMYLARIAAYDDSGPRLNAFISVNSAAHDDAAAMDAERAASGPRGPLHGIPIVVKDNINTADMPTTAGSLALADFRPKDDSFAVKKLREAGAIILGKSNLCEFATCWLSKSSYGGQTLDPFDLTRDPGGSSGGTAVAVAARLATAGLGTDTCGSVRLPAANNAIYGLRPTSGLVSRAGVIPFSTTLDEVGPMAGNVVDLAILLDVIAGVDPADSTTQSVSHSFADASTSDGLGGRRIGIVRLPQTGPSADPLRAAVSELLTNGAQTVDVRLPFNPIAGELYFSEFRFALEGYLAAQTNAPVDTLQEILDIEPFDSALTPTLRDFAAAPAIGPEAHKLVVSQRGTYRNALVKLMDDQGLDAIAYPSTSQVAAALDGGQQDHFDCAISAFSGLPALVIPAGFTSDGLPVGLELIGRPFDEATLIAIAAGFEANTDHRRLPATTPLLGSAL